MSEKTADSCGMVLSGGAVSGAYEIGVMKALFNGHSPATGFTPLKVKHFAGTSVGAYNAAVMVGLSSVTEAEGVAYLEELWRRRIASTSERCGNGVYRLRGNPLEYLDLECFVKQPWRLLVDLGRDSIFLAQRGLAEAVRFLRSDAPLFQRVLHGIDLCAFFSLEPMYSLVRETIDLDGIAKSEKSLVVVASDWQRSLPRFFTKADMVERLGYQPIVASAALPGIFPPVPIEDSVYVDGGLLVNTPLAPVIRAGADTLHVISMESDAVSGRELIGMNAARTMKRVLAVGWRSKIAFSLGSAKGMNQLWDEGLSPEILRKIARLLAPRGALRDASNPDPRLLEIHCYEPSEPLGDLIDLLDFSPEHIDHLIHLGYHDTVNHDCEACGCVLPSESSTPGRA